MLILTEKGDLTRLGFVCYLVLLAAHVGLIGWAIGDAVLKFRHGG